MATMRLVPSVLNNAAGTDYLTVSNEENALTNTDSTTYATVSNTNASTSNRYIYLRGFNFGSLPSGAIVSSFEIKYKASETGGSTSSSYRPRICNGTATLTGSSTAIGTTATTYSFTDVTDSWDTISGYGSDFGIRINCRRNARNTAASFNIYGAEILVTYTVPVYHTVTSSTTTGTIDPSGQTSVLEGDDYTLTISGASNPTVTDNNVDVTSQLVASTEASKTLIPDDYTNSNFTLSNITRAYADATSEDYATLDAAGRTTGELYLILEDLSIPSGATIKSVSCSATIQFSRNGSSSSVTASCQMYAGTSAKGSSTTITSSATDVAKTTFNLSIGSWTASEINNARFYITMYNGASSTHRYLYVYGVSFDVTYESDGVIYVYTLSNVTTDHTIVVTAGSSTATIYMKVNGSWTPISKAYKKVNGSWVEQSDLSNVFQSGVNYKKAGE